MLRFVSIYFSLLEQGISFLLVPIARTSSESAGVVLPRFHCVQFLLA